MAETAEAKYGNIIIKIDEKQDVRPGIGFNTQATNKNNHH